MLFLRIVGVCVCAAIVIAVIRPMRPEMAMLVALCASVVAFFLALDYLQPIYELILRLTAAARLSGEQTAIIMRVLGVTLVGECAARICQDAGEGTLASRIELAARLTMLVMALPLLQSLLDALLLLPQL